MSCYYPVLALDCGFDYEGNRKIQFIPHRVDLNINQLKELHGERMLLLPCGSCLACQVAKAKDWATRCYLESLEHKENCFITLTYDDDHCPDVVLKEDVQKFIRKLRDVTGKKLRYFACGEYGCKTHRPHYHMIVFGWMPPDGVRETRGAQGDWIYSSRFLDDLWEKGFTNFGEVTFLSAGYVARYTTKKIGDDGSFLLMSLKPGIGMHWIEKRKNIEFILKYDKLPGEFGSMKFVNLPRAFDKRIKELYPDIYEQLVKKRVQRAELFNLNEMNNYGVGNLEEVLKHRGYKLNEKLKRIERS